MTPSVNVNVNVNDSVVEQTASLPSKYILLLLLLKSFKLIIEIPIPGVLVEDSSSCPSVVAIVKISSAQSSFMEERS